MLKAAAPPVHAPEGRTPRFGPRPVAVGGALLATALISGRLVGGSASRMTEPPVLAFAPTAIVAPESDPSARSDEAKAVDLAKSTLAGCRDRYRRLKDYTCTFLKRERLEDGTATKSYVLTFKARVEPRSFYFKVLGPRCSAGREAIFVDGRNDGRVLVHDVGLGKLLGGTLKLDPRGPMAMEDNRHPITEAGLGHMIDTIVGRWDAEMRAGETRVTIRPDASAAGRTCTMIESAHPARRPGFLFQAVRVFIDRDLGLPIHFEAYDWPRHPGGTPELVEDYTYQNLRLDVGLTDRDFDPGNSTYSFGRF